MNETALPRPLHNKARYIIRALPAVLRQRGLKPAIKEWVATQSAQSGVWWLFGILDVEEIERLEAYTDAAVLHHLSTVLHTPILISNTSGMRYATFLSPLPSLPRKVEFPADAPRDMLGMGAGYRAHLSVPWGKVGHLLVAGMTGYGKSNFLRLIAYQALRDGLRLLLADPYGTTFAMLRGHPALQAPVAADAFSTQEIIGEALAECTRRAMHYEQIPGYPENLEEYNAAALKAGKEPLPRLLVILDEYTNLVAEAGGPRSSLAQSVDRLARIGRKFGITLIWAAQEFNRSLVGRLRDQGEAVAFRLRNADAARNLGLPQAVHLRRKGLAVSTRWGTFQSYLLPKKLLIEAAGASSRAGAPFRLSEEELRLLRLAQEHDGMLSIPILKKAGWSEWAARTILRRWEERGLLRRDHAGRRTITAVLREVASKSQGPQGPSKGLKAPQSSQGLPQGLVEGGMA